MQHMSFQFWDGQVDNVTWHKREDKEKTHAHYTHLQHTSKYSLLDDNDPSDAD